MWSLQKLIAKLQLGGGDDVLIFYGRGDLPGTSRD